VKVVVAGEVFTKVPVIVPDVNGVVRFVGEDMLSVFVMLALAGVTEYVAANEGLTTAAPTGTVQPPVKLVMANAVPSEMVIVLPPVTQFNPVPQAMVSAPVSVLSEATPAPAGAAYPPALFRNKVLLPVESRFTPFTVKPASTVVVLPAVTGVEPSVIGNPVPAAPAPTV
jgi:hypothetical protein